MALVNHRIHPADSVASVLAHDVATINDPRVKVTVFGPSTEPAPVSSHQTKAFDDIRSTVGLRGRAVRHAGPWLWASPLPPVVPELFPERSTLRSRLTLSPCGMRVSPSGA